RVRAGLPGILPEGAIAAVVPAERREGDEDLGGERARAPAAAIPRRGGCGQELGGALGGRREKGLGLREVGCAAGRGARQGAVERAHPPKLQCLTRPGVILTMVPASVRRALPP